MWKLLQNVNLAGTSDPYVKFKCGGRLIYKSRTVFRELNPVWDESFTVPVEDPFQPIQLKVFDYDWGLQVNKLLKYNSLKWIKRTYVEYAISRLYLKSIQNYKAYANLNVFIILYFCVLFLYYAALYIYNYFQQIFAIK